MIKIKGFAGGIERGSEMQEIEERKQLRAAEAARSKKIAGFGRDLEEPREEKINPQTFVADILIGAKNKEVQEAAQRFRTRLEEIKIEDPIWVGEMLARFRDAKDENDFLEYVQSRLKFARREEIKHGLFIAACEQFLAEARGEIQ